MKIKEILELTKTKSIKEVVQEHLTINEKEARLALKVAGCFNWAHEATKWEMDENEDPKNLDKSIYSFHKQEKGCNND